MTTVEFVVCQSGRSWLVTNTSMRDIVAFIYPAALHVG